jgi:hypothetical protein
MTSFALRVVLVGLNILPCTCVFLYYCLFSIFLFSSQGRFLVFRGVSFLLFRKFRLLSLFWFCFPSICLDFGHLGLVFVKDVSFSHPMGYSRALQNNQNTLQWCRKKWIILKNNIRNLSHGCYNCMVFLGGVVSASYGHEHFDHFVGHTTKTIEWQK